MSDMRDQADWWQSLTPAEREAYEDALARRQAERERYGRVLTPAERDEITSGPVHGPVLEHGGMESTRALEAAAGRMAARVARGQLERVLAAVRDTGMSAYPPAGESISPLVFAVAVECGANPVALQSIVAEYGRLLRRGMAPADAKRAAAEGAR